MAPVDCFSFLCLPKIMVCGNRINDSKDIALGRAGYLGTKGSVIGGVG